MRSSIGIVIALVAASSAAAQTPAFDPRSWKGQHDGPPTQVLTISANSKPW
jgi:hypothetical protein